MVVDQKARDAAAGGFDRCDRGFGVGHRDHLGVPRRQQRLHAVEDRRIVLDADDQGAAHRRPGKRRRAGDGGGMVDRCRNRHRHGKHRAAAGGSVDRDAMVEHARQPFDDRQAETEAAGDPGALFQAVKFLEDLAALGHGNTDAGVVDADLQRLSVAAATDQHAPARGIFDGVRDEVLQQPAQQRAVGLHRQRAGHEGQLQPLGARDRRELDLERTHQVGHLEA